MQKVIEEIMGKMFEEVIDITERDGHVLGVSTIKKLMEENGMYARIEDIINKGEWLGWENTHTIIGSSPINIESDEFVRSHFKSSQIQKGIQSAEDLPGYADAMEVPPIPDENRIIPREKVLAQIAKGEDVTFAERMNWKEHLVGVKRLSNTQEEIRLWSKHNFPAETAITNLLGVVEEVGELAHAELKGTMGVREGVSLDSCKDAVGDILIFLMSYCNQKEVSMDYILQGTWNKVRQRDWVLYPKNGKTE